MDELFGLSMTTIATVCVAIVIVIFAIIAWIAIRNPVMFKTGLRNIPRRPGQTALIAVGLMLSTLIVTAAFGVGDTMKYSIKEEVYQILGPVDEFISWDTDKQAAPQDEQNIPLDIVDGWQQQFADDPNITGFVALLIERMPIQNARTRLNQANPLIVAFRPGDVEPLGGLRDVDGNPVVIGPRQIVINRELAGEIDAEPGDTVRLFYEGQPIELEVVAIAPDTLFSGSFNTLSREGAAMNFETLAGIVGREGRADLVGISNSGDIHGGVASTDTVVETFEPILAETPYTIEGAKQDGLEEAELVANIFTSVFIIFGLFSIGAGVLLIFLIFIMLAAERKPEMGMARAVGARRRQIVESFLAEGMGYDLGSAVIGLIAGTGVAWLMTWFVRTRIGEDIGLNLQFDVTFRSLAVSFCLGVIVTFIVVFAASWRASRLNIVSAIRDLPETKPINPEGATLTGYVRAALNGMASYGFLVIGLLGMLRFPDLLPIFLVTAICGLPGPFLGMVRRHNFGAPRAARKQGDRLPVWPWIVGLLLAIAGIGIVMIVSYALAILVVRITRDRRPAAIPRGLLIAGVVVAPLGVALAALQDPKRISDSAVGFSVVGGLAGLLLVEWGLNGDRMAWLALGVSFLVLWAAMALRYFGRNERAIFTTASLVLLVFWYLLPGGRLDWLLGELRADFEMFFVTGAVLVTCGTFLIVYNADIILPLLARFGSRFGRLTPAVRTAVAYPLTSRFRTGLTIGMIGLIMFVLSMQSALNANFEATFTNEDSLGGFDVRVLINGNNRTDDLVATIEAGNDDEGVLQPVDTSRITALGELRIADAFTVDIEDPEWNGRNPEDEFKSFDVMGLNDSFIDAQQLPLKYRAAGFATDAEVWAALKANPQYAIIPAYLNGEDDGFGAEDTLRLPTEYTSEAFEPFTLNLRNPTTGQLTPVTVIGQTKESGDIFWYGIMVQERVVAETFPDAKNQQFFLALEDGTDPEAFAKSVESVLVQAESESLQKVVDDLQAQNRTFLELFQGFLGLGLLVGIAALGVISLRAVVERRQQIGMLRAIGYKRRMVQLSFLFESGFIALSGIILGLVLGISFAANLFTSGEFGDSTAGQTFLVPWGQILVITLFAFVASMVTTYLPARAASHVAVANALRYE